MKPERYLTKSRFKLATECEAKLFYTRKAEYADQSLDDPFLRELAKGGYQVGELAKYYCTDNPQEITITAIKYGEALRETEERIRRGERFIAEAAVNHKNLFIRVDIFQIDTSRKQIKFYEVKSKSWDANVDFYTRHRGTKEITGLDSTWKSYLYDVAFQKYVITQAYPGYSVEAYLTLVNKDAVASVDGLNQLFRIHKKDAGYEVVAKPGVCAKELGNKLLIDVCVDEVIRNIMRWEVESRVFPGFSFMDYIEVLSDAYAHDKKLTTPLSKECKKCQFYCNAGDEAKGLRSGMKECWTESLKISEAGFEKPKIIELWGGKAGAVSWVQKLMDKNKYFLEQVEMQDISPDITDNSEGELKPAQRRWEQIRKVKNHETSFYLDADGLRKEMNSWKYPLHFIDFETSQPALPFTKAAHPYEGIAFQYSHHVVYKNPDNTYRIEHKSQFLDTARGLNPNLKFIRSLHRDLAADEGTIFRYHRHENTYLRKIFSQLSQLNEKEVTDKKVLMDFIDDITEKKIDAKTSISGKRNMVDLWDIVLRFYYSPYAKGSNSLKQILPAAINDSLFLRNKYSRPVTRNGTDINSLNFDSHIWIQDDCGKDPYKTLPPVFENYSRDFLDEAFDDMDEVADGGAAMMAYCRLQFSDTPEDQREAIGQALLKYCELDTLAMVMLWEFWNNQVNN